MLAKHLTTPSNLCLLDSFSKNKVKCKPVWQDTPERYKQMFHDWAETDEALCNGTLESTDAALAGLVLNQTTSAGSAS